MKFLNFSNFSKKTRNLGAIKFPALALIFLALTLLGGAAWLKNSAHNSEFPGAPINREIVEKPEQKNDSTNNSTDKKTDNRNSQNHKNNAEKVAKNHSESAAQNSSKPKNREISGDNPENLASTGPGDFASLFFGIFSFLGCLYLLREYFLSKKLVREKLLGLN